MLFHELCITEGKRNRSDGRTSKIQKNIPLSRGDAMIYAIFIEGETFFKFKDAIHFCEDEFGYSGLLWNAIIETQDFNQLEEFLKHNGVFVETYED